MSHDDCHELFDRMSAYLDGEADEETVAKIEKHLKDCDCCKECAESIRAVRDMLAASKKKTLPEELKAKLKARLKRNCGK